MLTDKHISIKIITKEDNEKTRFQKAINEMLSKPAPERTQAAMDQLIDNVFTDEKQSKKH